MDIQREKEEAMKNSNGNKEKGNPFGNSDNSNNNATNLPTNNNNKKNPRT
jgi:hypothetical protein